MNVVTSPDLVRLSPAELPPNVQMASVNSPVVYNLDDMVGQREPGHPYTTRLQKGGALFDVLRHITLLWGKLDTDDLSAQVPGLPSRQRARDIVRRAFIPRFVESKPPDLWRVAAALECVGADRVHILPLHYYATAAAEPVLWDFVVEELLPRAGTGAVVKTEDVLGFLSRRPDAFYGGTRWTEAVATKVSQGLLAALRDYGILVGASKKRVGTVLLPITAFALIARIRYELGYRGARAIADEVWQLFFLNHTAVERFLAQAASERLIEFQSAGQVVRITFPEMPLEDYARYVVSRSAQPARV